MARTITVVLTHRQFVNAMQQMILYMFLRYGLREVSENTGDEGVCRINPNYKRHANTLSDPQLETITKWLFIEEIFYMSTHWTVKQAFLVFYLRLSPHKGLKLAVYGTMDLYTAFTIITWLLAILQCTPFDAILPPAKYPQATWINKFVLLVVPSVLNIVTDLIILTPPISTVVALQMSRRSKAVVLGIICFGSFSVITALCRFIILKQPTVDPDISFVLE
ncbi:hypothetical protein BBP40_003364 [Aspergillus hancockii]|nr:hypothetical protein BBP40_003364 [Aspergillus hancockii]